MPRTVSFPILTSADVPKAFFCSKPSQVVVAVERQLILPGRSRAFFEAYVSAILRAFLAKRLEPKKVALKGRRTEVSRQLEEIEVALIAIRTRSTSRQQLLPQLAFLIAFLRAEFGLAPSRVICAAAEDDTCSSPPFLPVYPGSPTSSCSSLDLDDDLPPLYEA